MYFLYVDGSGQTKIKKNHQNNGLYILSGILVHEKDWKNIEKSLDAVKQKIFPELSPTDWELHAYDIWNNHNRFADEKLNVTLEKKQEIFTKVLDFIYSSKITLLNSVIFKDAMKIQYPNLNPMESSWTFIVERFEHFLKSEPDETNNGLVFVDSSQKKPESEIKSVIWRLARYGSVMQRIDHVIEDPIFTKSHLRNLIQLADMVAYVVYKNYKGDPTFKGWFERLKPRMYQPNGRLYGFGIKEFPDKKLAGSRSTQM